MLKITERSGWGLFALLECSEVILLQKDLERELAEALLGETPLSLGVATYLH